MTTPSTTDTVLGQKLVRVAAAEAELVGVTAERDALRVENEQLLEQVQGMDRNLDEVEQLREGRWFTAADAEPDDLDDHVVLCSPTRGLVFVQRYDGSWETPHLSHTGFDWPDMLEQYGPLLLVTDVDAPQRVVKELTRRRGDERQVQRALWDCERTLRSRARPMGFPAEGPIGELHAKVDGIIEPGRIGGAPVEWAERVVQLIALLTTAVGQLDTARRNAARAGADR